MSIPIPALTLEEPAPPPAGTGRRRGKRSALGRYAAALAAVALATLLTVILPPMGRAPTTLYFAAVLASAWYGGLGPGVLATFLSVLALDFFWAPPLGFALGMGLLDAVWVSVFALAALAVSSLTAAQERARARLEEARDGLGKEVEERTQELVCVNRVLRDWVARLEEAEKALEDSEALYRSLVESLPLRLFRKDREGRFTFGNQRFCATLGLSLDQLVGKTLFDLMPRERAERYHLEDQTVLETGRVLELVEERYTPEGEKSYHQVVKAPVYDARGQIVGIQGSICDVTAGKRAEEEMRRHASEVQVARLIQQKLYPAAAPQPVSLDMGGGSYPAQAVGGDYFDFLPLPDQSTGVIIGDVSGHGLGPALLMAETRAFLRALAQTEADLPKILTLTNRVLTEDTGGEHFVTLFFASIDPRTRSFRYASAGHPAGYLLGASGEVKVRLTSTGLPLGLFPEGEFPASDPVPLEPGDLLVLLTDGVVEAFDPEGATFGAERALQIVRLYREDSPRQIVANLYFGVRAFTQNAPQCDDITAVVVKVGPAP